MRPATLPAHHGQHRPHTPVGAVQVDVNDPRPVGGRNVVEAAVFGVDTGVIDEQVETARAQRLTTLHGRLHRCQVGHVGGKRPALPAGLRYLCGDLLQGLRPAAEQADAGARLGQRAGRGRANTRPGARDQRDLSGERLRHRLPAGKRREPREAAAAHPCVFSSVGGSTPRATAHPPRIPWIRGNDRDMSTAREAVTVVGLPR